MKLSEIYEGWRNHISPPEELKNIIEKTSIDRLSICRNCEWHSKNKDSIRIDEHCTKCGCTLSAKTKCLSCTCPLESPKWEPIVTEKQYTKMKEYGK